MVAQQQERRGEKRNHSEMITGSSACSSDMDTFYHGPQGKKVKVSSNKLTGEDQGGKNNNKNCHHHDSLGHHPLSKINGSGISCPFSPTSHNTASPSSSSTSSSLSPSSSSSPSSPFHHSSSVQGALSSSSCEGKEGDEEETMKSEQCLVNGGGGSKSKRIRTIFKAEQLEKLELEFTHQQYMVGPERQALAASLDLTEAQVKVWFQNRRIKWRKQNEEDNKRRMVTFQPASSSTNGSETSVSDIHDQPYSLNDVNRSPLHQQLVFNFH